jgi:hypothetical protein
MDWRRSSRIGRGTLVFEGLDRIQDAMFLCFFMGRV